MNYKYSDLKHGQSVKGIVAGMPFTDGKISIDEDGDVFICQNVKCGCSTDEKLGYKYSWLLVSRGEDIDYKDSSYINIELDSPVTWENLKIGDTIELRRSGEVIVLARIGDCILLSVNNSPNQCSAYWNTIFELKERGYTIKQPKPTIKEVTLDEVAKAMHIPVSELRIKE